MEKLNKIILSTLLFTLCLITISSASAADVHMNSTNNRIANATANGTGSTGGTIYLDEGTYDHSHLNGTNGISINKEITIIGKGADKTIINAQNFGRMFNITSTGSLTLINLTLINGNITDYGGGAIYNDGTLTITNCIFTNNRDSLYYGGGAIQNNGYMTIKNSNFTNNTSINGDGGAICNNDDNVIIDNCYFDSNAAIKGGAIYNYGNMNISNSNFTNNNANSGGAIYNSYELNISNCLFKDNKAENSGGAISNSRNMNITNSIFTNNNASWNGGAIFNDGRYMRINNSSFANNTADYGGAIVNANRLEFFSINYPLTIDYNDYTILIINSVFKNNTANQGGAIYNNRDNMLVENSTFLNNTADFGAAIFNDGSCITIMGSNFTDNKDGATITLYSWNNVITGCNIINNTAGILITNYASNILVNYNRIFNNTDYDLTYLFIGEVEDFDPEINIDYNWWGNNTPDKIFGITPNNWFVMNVTNATSLDSNGTVKFNYTFKLNTGDNADNSLLPYFVTDVYTNLTSGIITSFDARNDNVFDVTVNTSGNILYTFITDNEIQTLEGTATVPEPIDPDDPDDPDDPVDPDDPDDPDDDDTTETSNNPTASASMKETGIPIVILLVLLSLIGFGYYRKQ